MFILACSVLAEEQSQRPDYLEETTEDDTTTPEADPEDQDVMQNLGAEIEETDDGTQYNIQEADDFSVPTSDQTISWQTNSGPITQLSLVDALFSGGNFVQGSLVSFANANPLSFQSLFDSSLFTLTLNEEDQAEIAQTNGFGELGYTYITTTGGNLTQDGAIIFIPDGDTPTYIYYNTTEIEFEDGSVYLLGESLTNTDDTQESSTVEFNENGFTKVQIQPENNYTVQHYTFINKQEDAVYACKDDSLCPINIQDEQITIKGKVELYFDNEIAIQSLDENNEFILDHVNNILTFDNSRPREQTLAYIYNAHHKIIETSGLTYSEITEQEYPMMFTTYQSDVTYTFEDGTLVYNTMRIIPPTEPEYRTFWNKINDYQVMLTGSYIWVF